MAKNYYGKYYIWSWALRIFHWTFALSIVTLIITGFYIHDPLTTTTWSEARPSYLMVNIRYLHFIAAFFFISALILRLYLLFFGNKYERVTDFLPLSTEKAKSLGQTIKYYLYLTPKSEGAYGHNVLAGISYVIIFFLAIIMVLTGLYMLYPESNFFKRIGSALFGVQQVARALHYLLFWFFTIFIIIHLYIITWHELKHPEGLISSMFSGKKFIAVKEKREIY